jgi:hypothetical protein
MIIGVRLSSEPRYASISEPPPTQTAPRERSNTSAHRRRGTCPRCSGRSPVRWAADSSDDDPRSSRCDSHRRRNAPGGVPRSKVRGRRSSAGAACLARASRGHLVGRHHRRRSAGRGLLRGWNVSDGPRSRSRGPRMGHRQTIPCHAGRCAGAGGGSPAVAPRQPTRPDATSQRTRSRGAASLSHRARGGTRQRARPCCGASDGDSLDRSGDAPGQHHTRNCGSRKERALPFNLACSSVSLLCPLA